MTETTHRVGAAPPRSSRSLPPGERGWLARWIAVVSAAETIGFVAPAIVGVLASDSPGVVPLLLLAGGIEGALLGLGQAVVLRMRLARLHRTAWVLLTMAAAVVAYAVGMVPSQLSEVWTRWTWPAQAGLLVALGVILLLSIGSAQWWELRRHVRHAGWWIPATAVAWLAALTLFLAIAMPLWHEGQDSAAAVLVGVVAGLVMAVAMATVTGLFLQRLLRRPLS